MKNAEDTQMVKRKICRQGYYRGYWKGECIALIPRYLPDTNPEDYVIEETEFPSDFAVPRLIDPAETPPSVIREMCEVNNWPFSVFTGIGMKGQKKIQLTEINSIQEAIEYFLALGTTGTTTDQYRRIFDNLIRANIIDTNLLIDRYLEKVDQIETSVFDFSILNVKNRKHYNYSDKIHHLFRSFHAFLRNPNCFFELRGERKSNRSYRAKRKNRLSENEAKIFFPALKAVNPTHELIARILWWYNREICDHPDAPVIHLESVLQMQKYDIGKDVLEDIRESLPDDIGGNTICIHSHTSYAYTIVSYYVRGSMYSELSELARNTDHFIFRNKYGDSIDPRLVRRSCAKACKNANLRNITPSQLR